MLLGLGKLSDEVASPIYTILKNVVVRAEAVK